MRLIVSIFLTHLLRDASALQSSFGKSRTNCILRSNVKDSEYSNARKFYIAPSNFLNVLGSSVQMLLRLGSGVFVDGYKIAIVDDEPGAYAVYRGNGKRVSETAVVGKRPVQPIELYEFEGCPFCRKVTFLCEN